MKKQLLIIFCVLAVTFGDIATPNIQPDLTKQIFAKDKLDHVIYSAYLYKLLHGQWGKQDQAISAVLSIGLAKEIFDLYFGHTGFDLLDLSADGVGVILGCSF